VYSEELMTVSVSTDYTKPDPRERERERAYRQTEQRKESENSSSRSASTRKWWSFPVTAKFMTASSITLPFPISFGLGSTTRTSRGQRYSGWLCAALPEWMDGHGLSTWLLHYNTRALIFILFYFTLPILNSRVVGRSTCNYTFISM